MKYEYLDTMITGLRDLKNRYASQDFLARNTKVADVIKTRGGKVVFTGLGKAGLAAQKAAATFCSLGIAAVYMDPATALHGDLGCVQDDDIVVALSNSGETREVLEALALLGPKVFTVAVTSTRNSSLSKTVNICLDFGVVKEAGAMALAPTTSFLVMVALLDCLALYVSESRGWTLKDFGTVHHAGYLHDKAKELIAAEEKRKVH